MKKVYIERNKLFKSFPMLLCNNITQVDEDFIEDNPSIFWTPCEYCEESGTVSGEECEECYGEGKHDREPYQFFLTALSEWEKERLEAFGVEYGYSEALVLDVIPIYDFGTSWSAFSYSKEEADDYELSHDETLERTTTY